MLPRPFLPRYSACIGNVNVCCLEALWIASPGADEKVCCRKHEGRAFQVAGCDIKDLEHQGLSHSGHDPALEGIPSPAHLSAALQVSVSSKGVFSWGSVPEKTYAGRDATERGWAHLALRCSGGRSQRR